ncbi:MAG: hypothetical protein AAFY70_01820, partial [Bacteroidota bacterium]
MRILPFAILGSIIISLLSCSKKVDREMILDINNYPSDLAEILESKEEKSSLGFLTYYIENNLQKLQGKRYKTVLSEGL